MFTVLLTAFAALALAAPSPRSSAAVAYFDPTAGGGSWLDVAGTGVGEPMNVRPALSFLSLLSLPSSSLLGPITSSGAPTFPSCCALRSANPWR